MDYGTTTAYGTSTPLNGTLTTSHSVALTGLLASTLYHYRVKSKDAGGNPATSGDFTFTSAPNNGIPPSLSGIQAVANSNSGAYILWNTNTSSSSQVDYGTTTAYGVSTSLDPTLVTSHSVALSGLAPSTLYHYRVRSMDLCGNLATSADFTLMTGSAPPNTIWSSTTTPAITSQADTSAIEVGVRFTSDVGGYITGVRFYKGSVNTGTHVGNLWAINGTTGTLLASATFTNETATGWQQVNFGTPVLITASTAYIASYHTNTGGYSVNSSYFASAGTDSPPLHALRDGVSGGNGVFLYTASSAFPIQTFQSTNYWVDVVFVPANDTTPPVITAVQAGALSCSAATVTWTTDKAADSQTDYGLTTAYGASTTLDPTLVTSHSQLVGGLTPSTLYHYRVKSKSSPINLATSSDFTFTTAANDGILPVLSAIQAVAVTNTGASITWTSSKASSSQVDYGLTATYGTSTTLDPTAVTSHSVLLTGLAPTTLYHFRVNSRDLCGNLATSGDFTFTTGGTAPNTIWAATATPAIASQADSASVEVGVKFQSDINGYITGIRFYKGSANTGTHVGSLWSLTGTPLGSATFTNETATGWQQVNFAAPVAVTANTVYVASYHANVGGYSLDQNYFASVGVDNPPLHALRNGVSGGNGVFIYSASSTFPTQTSNSSNYWVDVVFTSGATRTQTGLTAAPASFTLTAAGATQQLAVTANYSDGSTQNVTSNASTTYSSNTTAVATVNATGQVTAVANGTATITASFGGFGSTSAATVNISAVTQTGLTVAPTSFTLTTAGATQQLTVTATYSDGSTQNVTSNPSTTYSSNNTAVATVNATGQVKAVANGTATITASAGGFAPTSTATVNIAAGTQTGVTVAPASVTLAAGATQQLTVTATYSDGSTQNVTSNAGTTYSSTSGAVATVNATGLVQAVAAGSATINATFGGFSANAIVTVTVAIGLVAAYGFSEGSGTTVTDSSGRGNNGTIAAATWTTAGHSGNALSFNGTNSWVTVNDAASLDLTNGMTVEAWVKLTTVSGWRAVVIKETTGGLAYGLYANTNLNRPAGAIHTTTDVNLYGTAALVANTWTHLATTYDGANLHLYVNGAQVASQAFTGSLPNSTNPLRIGGDSVWGEFLSGVIDDVRVYNRALSVTEIQTDMNTPVNSSAQNGLTAAPSSFTLSGAGATQQLTVTATYADGSTQNVTSNAATTYSSNNTGVATVSSTGLVRAVASGTATITASFGGFPASVAASVKTQTGLTAAPASFTLTTTGATQQLTVTATYSDGTTQNVTSNASTTYSSNNTAVATVTATGQVRAVANGTATITASFGGFASPSTATVNISAATQTGLTSAPASFTLTTAGATQQLTVTATYSDGTTQNVTSNASTTYSSNNTAVATVNATGLVQAVANGTATITASFGGFPSPSTATVNISAATQTGLTVAPASFTLAAVGATQQLTVTATYSDSSTQNVTSNAGTTYSSTSSAVATVNATGLVQAVAAGSATIRATFGGFSANATVTVAAGLVAAYGFNEGSGTTVTDSSGRGNNGTISAATWTTAGHSGNALSFNGTNSWVTVNDAASLDLTNGMTVEAWVKLTTVSNWRAVIIKETTGGLAYGLYANTNLNRPDAVIHTSTDVNLYGTAALAANTWTHLAATYDGANLRLYVNGAQVASQAFTGNMPNSTSPLRIGGDSVWGEFLNGVIDDVRVYNRALSVTEIQTDMNAPL